MAKNNNGKKKKEQMINDLYNEITRLKMENEKLRKGYNSAADTSVIDEAEISEPKKEVKLDKEDQKIIKFASRFAKKLGLDTEDLEEMKEELAATDDIARKKNFMDKLERKVVEIDCSEQLANIEAMKLAGKSPLEILKSLPGYQDIADEKDDSKIIGRLMAKMRQKAFGESQSYGFGGLRF